MGNWPASNSGDNDVDWVASDAARQPGLLLLPLAAAIRCSTECVTEP